MDCLKFEGNGEVEYLKIINVKRGKVFTSMGPRVERNPTRWKNTHKLDLSKIKCFNQKTNKRTHAKVNTLTQKGEIFNRLSRLIQDCTNNVSLNPQFFLKKTLTPSSNEELSPKEAWSLRFPVPKVGCMF